MPAGTSTRPPAELARPSCPVPLGRCRCSADIGTAAQQVAAAELQKASLLKGSGSAAQPEQGKLSIGPKSPRQRRTGALPVLLGDR